MTFLHRGGVAASALLALSFFTPSNFCYAQSSQPGGSNMQTSPYIGQDRRTIKSLSDKKSQIFWRGKE